MAAVGSFDSLNPVLFKGEAGVGLGLVFETLMSDSLQEPSTSYGLIAEWVSHPEDYSSVTFKLRDEARWHDGKPITVEDVIFSLEMTKKANPRWGFYYKNVVKAEKTGERDGHLLLRRQGQSRAAHDHGAADGPAQALLDGQGAEGRDPRPDEDDARAAGRLRPLSHQGGEAGPHHRLRARPGLLGGEAAGQCRPAQFRAAPFEYYRDATVALEAFKADRLDFRAENNSKDWATGYDFKAAEKGWVKRSKVFLKTSQRMQGFVFNIRRREAHRPRAYVTPSTWPTTSNGRTRPCSTASINGSAAISRTPSWRRAACRRGRSWRS